MPAVVWMVLIRVMKSRSSFMVLKLIGFVLIMSMPGKAFETFNRVKCCGEK